MNDKPAPDPTDWRTWERDGVRLFPPPGTTSEQVFAGVCAFSAARWGLDPDRPRKPRPLRVRVLKKVDGKYEQISFRCTTSRGAIDVKVYGGCRHIQAPGAVPVN
ncbi:MAG TPA: hypothetical protein VF092_11800 [Longimicrobium sp.]